MGVKLPWPPRQLLPSQALTFPQGEGSNSAASQASQAGALLPPKEGRRQAGALLPPGKGISLAPSPASQACTHLPPAGENSSQAGNNPPQVRQAIKLLGQAGITPGAQPGKGPSRVPRVSTLLLRQAALAPRMPISHLTSPIGSLKGLPQKTPTLSGSLTSQHTFATSTKVCPG